jgi:RNA polymerase sigma-70 factor (ECF subfamily)
MAKPDPPKSALSEPHTWLERHGDALYRYAFFRLRDMDMAEDLVQETLLAAFQARADFAGRSAERTWLIGILKNKLVDTLRKHAREVSVEALADGPDAIDALFNDDRRQHWRTPPGAWENPNAALEQKQFWAVFRECIETLPPRQARAFVLCEIDGLDGKEACKVLDVEPSNVWVMLHRARLRLRQCLEKHWFGGARGK